MNLNRTQIKELLAAEKRSLQILDAHLKDLESLVESESMADWQRAAKRHPYVYSAVGQDGDPGIPLVDLSTEDNNTQFNREAVFEGLVTVQSDAPFIWTHLMCVQTELDGRFMSIQQSDGLGTFSALQELGFIENGSGRILFQADRDQEVGELLGSPFFDTYREYEADEPASRAGVAVWNPGAYAQGHGPNAPFELSAEIALPMNGSVTVQAKPAIYNMDSNQLRADSPWGKRLFVSLLGYKVFGD